jgi:hypothetical protein
MSRGVPDRLIQRPLGGPAIGQEPGVANKEITEARDLLSARQQLYRGETVEETSWVVIAMDQQRAGTPAAMRTWIP